jgi:membrane-bound metal-dependent hydrolase YbcI (DUF457 family)
MNTSMPSPIGHTLAGIAVALMGDRRLTAGIRSTLSRPLVLACAALAALPDLDLVVPGAHRTATHSVTATLFIMIVAAVVTGWVTGRDGRDVLRTALMCGLAHASHLLTDWLGTDLSAPSGIQLLWPFDDRWFISGWNLFPRIERRQMFSTATILINIKAAVWEIAAFVPVLVAAWWLRRRSGSRRHAEAAHPSKTPV